MEIKLKHAKTVDEKSHLVILLNRVDEVELYCRDERAVQYVKGKIADQKSIILINQYDRLLLFVAPLGNKQGHLLREAYRRKGFEIAGIVKAEKLQQIQVTAELSDPILDFCEGFLLSLYNFNKYKTEKDNRGLALSSITACHAAIKNKNIKELQAIVEGTFLARDLVNEPAIALNAEKLSKVFKKIGKELNFKVEVFDKAKIKALKMGGLLSVNAGSQDPPSFNILEYKPDKAINKKPYVLVGKGVTYDTGGLSIKPSTSMDTMKSDMAGSAAVAGVFYAAVKNELPIYLVGLVPATDNRPGENAITPGDVITISNGSTVEVLNTDAEGRLILADALSYARKYQPELVIDLATLTGAAAVAIGKEGAVMMGSAHEDYKTKLKEAGNEVYERMVEFPLWEEYRDYIKSDIADIKNIGGRTAGAITAGTFLQHFIDYDWIHLDIAGTAFLDAPDSYKGKNGTGYGVRLLYQFFKNIAHA